MGSGIFAGLDSRSRRLARHIVAGDFTRRTRSFIDNVDHQLSYPLTGLRGEYGPDDLRFYLIDDIVVLIGYVVHNVGHHKIATVHDRAVCVDKLDGRNRRGFAE